MTDWRTPGTPKGSADIDSDNILGSSLGAVHWARGSTGQTANNSGNFGWSYRGDTGQNRAGAYTDIDDLLTPAVDSDAGIAALSTLTGTFAFGLEGTAADYANRKVRVGVMADLLGPAENAGDVTKTYRLTGPGGADSGVVSLRGGAAGNGVPEMYFFDIFGIVPGDVYTLTTLNTGGSTQSVYIGPVSWDIAIAPEPGRALLGVFGLLALAGQRRRRA